MQYKFLLSALLMGLSLTTEVAAKGGFGQGNQGAGSQTAAATNAQSTGSSTSNSGSNAGSNQLALNPNAVQTGSQQNGLQASGVEAGESASATDSANFVNFCEGKTLTNGLQQKQGSCNGIVMGNIPATTSMVSTIITFPEPGQDIEENQTFNLSANIQNLQAGAFTNAQATYYSAPQDLNSAGQIIGHLHFSVQAMTSMTPSTALDATTFAFFKGVNDAGDGKGNLQAEVTGGLPAGTYRVCTMSSAANHQPVLMPVAQRGAQDDCTKFTVGAGNNNAASGSSSTASTATSAAASTATSTASTSGNTGGKAGANTNKGAGKGGNTSTSTNCNKSAQKSRKVRRSWQG